MAELTPSLILQVATGPDYAEMLRITSARHQAYADRYGFDLWQMQFAGGSYISWRRWEIVLLALRYGYGFVACIDADAVIANTSVDLRECLPMGGHLAMVYGQAPGGEPMHYNAGVCYLRNTSTVRSLLALLLRRTPAGEYRARRDWWNDAKSDQRVLNHLLGLKRFEGMVRAVDRRWNAVPYDHSFREPVVLHLAGQIDNAKRKDALRRYA